MGKRPYRGGGRKKKDATRRLFNLDSGLDAKLRAYSRQRGCDDTAALEAILTQFFTTQQNTPQ